MTIPNYIHFTTNPSATINSLIEELKPDKVAILVDENTRAHCLPLISNVASDTIIEITCGEINKTLDTCQKIWLKLTQEGFSRKSLLINLGGGVIGDMGGFCASTFKRGIRFINIPTTLLAAVDANIGGKLGIDFMGYKNHIGVFNDPTAVIVSDIYLKTLPERELKSGFAEVIKHGLIADAQYWNTLQRNQFPNYNWQELIRHSIGIKGMVVSEDPFENGKRKILNFGHTLGHAIETYYLNNGLSLLHGEAIACGMILEGNISFQKELLGQEKMQSMARFINNNYEKIDIPELGELQKLMSHDKKNEGSTINFSLINDIGSCLYDQKVDENLITEAINFYENFK